MGRRLTGEKPKPATLRQRRWRAKKKRLAARKRMLAPGSNTPAHDLIMTPPALAQSVVDHFAPTGRLLDPCRGDGAFYDALRRHSADVDWCEITEGRDFLAHRDPADWIISNPPWSKLRAFLKHAMAIADNIVFLVTVTHIVTKARLRDIAGAGFAVTAVLPVDTPPPPWPGGGFQLAAVLIQRGGRSIFG